MTDTYPGNARHQALLNCIVAHYQADPRMRAVCLFGSLVRGNWDNFSDLDLDVVIQDDVQIDILAELQALGGAFAPLNDAIMLLVPRGADSGDVVLASLAEFSIRYHVLADTSPNIIDSLKVLTGTLALEEIKAAGLANRQPPRTLSEHDVDGFLRHAIEVQNNLRRGRFWLAEHLLWLMRQTLIDIFAVSRGYVRALHAFDLHADAALKASLSHTLPGADLASLHAALVHSIEVLELQLTTLANGQLQLTALQQAAIQKLRQQWENNS